MKSYSVTYISSYEDISKDKGYLRETRRFSGPKELYPFGKDAKNITNNIIRRSIESIFGI